VIGVPVPLTDSADPDGARPDVTAPDPVPEESTARPKRG